MTPPLGTPVLEAAGLVKHYDGRKVLGGVDVQLAPGETVAVVGPNGSGKSTLLRVLAAMSRPDGGTLVITGIDAVSKADEARRSLALVPQDPPLYDELTCLEHLQWWGRLTGRTSEPATLLREAGLGLHMGRRAGSLSRGQRQRLALAMALVGDPAVLLLDEPFTALDADGRSWLETVLAARRGRRVTILALHGEDARRLADRTLTLRHHQLQVTA